MSPNAVDLGSEALASYVSSEAKASLPKVIFVLIQQH